MVLGMLAYPVKIYEAYPSQYSHSLNKNLAFQHLMFRYNDLLSVGDEFPLAFVFL